MPGNSAKRVVKSWLALVVMSLLQIPGAVILTLDESEMCDSVNVTTGVCVEGFSTSKLLS